jgi:hypothetical protein
MAVPTKIKKFFGKCKKPFICLSKVTKISKKNKKETITSPIITNTTTITNVNIPIKEEIIAKEIKLNTVQGNTKVTLPETKFISTKEKPFYQFDTKPQQPIQPQPQPRPHQQPLHPPLHPPHHPQQSYPYPHMHPKNNYKRYSINNIFNKPKLSPVSPR